MKIITKKIGTTNWQIVYPDDINEYLEQSEELGYHVSDWAWRHAYCFGINLDNGKEMWLPKNYIDNLLEETARENFIKIYYDPKFEYLADKADINRDFYKCWEQLKTRKEKEDFAINCCYYNDKETGECKIYFHVFDLETNHYNDLELEEYRNRDRKSFKMWNSFDGENC